MDTIAHCSNFVNLLERRAYEQPEQDAYIFLTHGERESDRLSYQEVSKRVRAVATCLLSMKATGKQALLLYPPGLEFVIAFLGCLYAGVTAVPAYPPRKNQNLSRIETILIDSDASVLLTTHAYLNRIEQGLS